MGADNMATPYLTVNIIRMQTTTLRIRNCVWQAQFIHHTYAPSAGTLFTLCVCALALCLCLSLCVCVLALLTSLNLLHATQFFATCLVCFTFHLQHLPPYLMPFTK